MIVYKQTPAELMRLIHLFHAHKLNYVLFKCEHIFAGANKNLDILFETDDGYHQAARILENEDYVIRFSEKFEKYKTMYCGLKDGQLYSVHLHREIAWHGIVVLGKKEVFARKQIVTSEIVVPGVEDAILIHAAHAIFENFKVTEKELFYLHQFSSASANKNYMLEQAARYHWKRGFLRVVRRKKELTKGEALFALVSKCVVDFVKLRPRSLAALLWKAVGKLWRRRQGCVIALIGVNGAGKSTLARELLRAYEPLTRHLGLKQKGYYYGWEPFSPVAKLVSLVVKKRNVAVFDDVNKKNHSGLFHGFVFFYNYIDYTLRYLFKVYPAVRTGLVVTDRYFYDLYGQYMYGPKSRLLPVLMKLFPQPDVVFVLDAPVSALVVRQKENKLYSDIQKSPERKVKDISDLERQRERYFELKRMFDGELIDTTRNVKYNVGLMIGKSWRKVVRRD